MKLPHMPLWVYDIEADEACALMSLSEYGAYMRLLQRQWIEGSIPADPTRLATLLRVTADQFDTIWPALSPKFVQDGRGRLKNHRLDEERQAAVAKVQKNRANGAKGGRPRKPDQTEGETQKKPNGLIPASGSGSDSGVRSSGKGGVGERGSPDENPALWDIPARLDTPTFRENWAEWLHWRRTENGARVTPRSAKSTLAKLEPHGVDHAIATLDESIANNWRGVFPDRTSLRGAPAGRGQPGGTRPGEFAESIDVASAIL